MPDPTRPGCPASDRDNDAVPDSTDACPDRPGAPSANPRQNGCPGLVLVTGGLIRINRPVFFANNSDRLLPRSSAILQAVADALRLAPQIRRVRVEGHTDNTGPQAHNMDLSQRRAQSVVAWLTEHGVEGGRLEAQGLGPTRPLRPNITLASRAMNRRVEFHITDPVPPRTPAPGR
jgi:outer membrane protein OmpA-like peptidoglycan-associated protein